MLGLGLSVARPPLIRVGAGGGGGGGGPYPVNAVNFDGTNDMLSRGAAFTGQVSHAAMIGSFWFLPATDAVRTYLGECNQTDSARHPWEVSRQASNKLRVIVRNAANNVRVHWDGDDALLVAGGWNHLLFGINLIGSPVAKFYVNDVAQTAPVTGPITDSIAWGDVIQGRIGAKTTGGDKWDGDMAEVYINNGEYLDFGVTANRRKFIDADGFPVDLGAGGITPTGTAAIIMHSGATVDWHTNKGSGGGMTESGALTDAATSPSD